MLRISYLSFLKRKKPTSEPKAFARDIIPNQFVRCPSVSRVAPKLPPKTLPWAGACEK